MKKLFRFDTILVLVIVLFCVVPFYEAYRISTLFTIDDPEVAYTYETILYGVPIMLFITYGIFYIRFSNYYNDFNRVVRYTFFTVMFALISSSYYLGLNMHSIVTQNEDAFSYQLGLPVGWAVLLLLSIATINSFLVYRYTTFHSKKSFMIASQVLISMLYFMIFVTIVTDSVAVMGLFDT